MIEQQRRSSDGDGTPKPPTLSDIYKLLLELKDSHDDLIDAFVLDDLGRPDFTGHRLQHKQQLLAAETMQNHKINLTKSLLDWIAKGAIVIIFVSLMSSGIAYLKDHLK